MKKFNNVNIRYYVVSSIMIVIGIISAILLVRPLTVGSEEANNIEIDTTTTEIMTTTIASTISTLTTQKTTCSTTLEETTDINITSSECVTTAVETEPIPEYIVYKPSTHYVHKSTCRWANNTCERITDTDGIECRKCSECNPDIEIVNSYPPVVEIDDTALDNSEETNEEDVINEQTSEEVVSNTLPITDEEFLYLCRIVYHEAGSYWISSYEKSQIVAGVMNRVNNSRWPNNVLGVLTQPYQFSGFDPYKDVSSYTNYQACVDAVYAYFENPDAYGSHNSWYGNGRNNVFYYQ